MNTKLLLKGFEVELFTGRFTGENVGVAAATATASLGIIPWEVGMSSHLSSTVHHQPPAISLQPSVLSAQQFAFLFS